MGVVEGGHRRISVSFARGVAVRIPDALVAALPVLIAAATIPVPVDILVLGIIRII